MRIYLPIPIAIIKVHLRILACCWRIFIFALITDRELAEAALPEGFEPLTDTAQKTVNAKGSLETFQRATKIINKYNRRVSAKGRRGRGGNGGSRSKAPPAGEITFHKKIGAHDITVVHVLSPERFVDWVEEALKKAGVVSPRVPDWARQAVNEYIRDGFDWFVFDTIELGPKIKTSQPIRYRFKTDRLFYPLRITKVAGPTTVDLVVLSPRLLSKFPGLPGERIELPHRPFTIKDSELEYIDKEMAAMLGHQPSLKLRIWKLHVRGQGFTKDIIAY